jgi:hypothetical protein
MGIFNVDNIIRGVKPQKQKPPASNNNFNKKKPLNNRNFPQLSFAKYRFHGYKTDSAGIRHPVSWVETLPAGRRVKLRKKDYPGVTVTRLEPIGLYGPILE